MTQLIDERGSLTLHHDAGDERTPETFTVIHRDQPDLMASLEVARNYFELSDKAGQPVRLNGSQAATVKHWYEKHL